MSEENEPKEPVEPKAKTFTEEELNKRIEEATGGLKAKVEELLGEKKTVSQRAKELEEQQAKAEEERLQKEQQFKELYEREQKSKQELAEKYETFAQKVQRQEISLQTQNIAGELTRDTARAELLSEKAAQFAKYSEDGVTFELGGVTVDKAKVIEHLRDKYPFLADGSGATGGGAAGRGAEPQKKPSEYTEAERVQLFRENPDKFRQVFQSN